MKIIKSWTKTQLNEWQKSKKKHSRTILAIHVIAIIGVFVAAFFIQPSL